MNRSPIFALLPCLLLTLFLSGCGIIDYYFLTPPEDTAQELAQAGFEAMEAREYRQAVTYFTRLRDRYPFSPFTSAAELALGDAYFLSGQYQAAAQTYLEFESLHPGHEAIPYVLHQIGMSYLRQFRSIDRPIDNLHQALQYFRRLQQTYPQSPQAQEAEQAILETRTRIAEHELFVADFYWRRNQYGPAWRRYQSVVRDFGDIPEIGEYAERQANFAYYHFQRQQAQEDREEREGTWKRLLDWL